ncbi:spore coat protein [Sporosarcina sp. HYO08]|uniref:spore coat protein n=1 Tax=Sporosarcina sp. HYO08 TaxID=1759557 RepID=UPI00079A7F51|nr:spore coat protein [Sporosarcina sp. HYO08]KXH87051.1 hypothetical protein AU377_00270 [Sporosarcina sp. HYO08]
MTAKKIENPKTPLPEKAMQNDYDLMKNLLSIEKSLQETYLSAIQQVSHEKLYSTTFALLKATSEQYRKIFDLMFTHGWVSLTPAPSEEVKAVKEEYEQMKQQL